MKTLKTPRLTLRPLNVRDTNDVFSILSDPASAWWADLVPMTDEKEAADLIRWGNMEWDIAQWGLCEKGSDRVIGILQVMNPLYTGHEGQFALGYVVDPSCRRRGYMSEAVKAACRHLFRDPSVETVVLEILPGNAPSRGVARKAGFTIRETDPASGPKRSLDGKPLDTFVMTRHSLPAAVAA